MTCTPRPGYPSSRTACWYVQYEHRDIVVLLVTSEHTFYEVLKEPFGMGQYVRIGAGGHRGQFVKT